MADFKLITKIPQAIKLIEQGTMQGIEKGAITVHADASRLAPVDTGRLRGSITWRMETDHAIVGTNVVYAPRIEYTGHSKKAPNGFLRPAYDSNKENITRFISNSIESLLKGL